MAICSLKETLINLGVCFRSIRKGAGNRASTKELDAVVVDVVALSAGWTKLVSWQQISKRNAKSQTAQFLPWEPYKIMI